MKIFDFFRKYMGKMAGAEIFDKLEPEPKFLTSRSRAAQKWTGSATLPSSIGGTRQTRACWWAHTGRHALVR
jgi:hypothetical protein